MNKELVEDLRSIVKDILTSEHARTEAKFDLITFKLDQIHAETSKTNGRVTRLEQKVIDLDKEDAEQKNHVYTCPVNLRVKKLEDKNLGELSIKNWLMAAFGIAVTIIGVIITVIKLWL